MAKQRQIEWTNRHSLHGVAIGALLCTLFGTAWVGAPAGTLSTTSLATALSAVSAVGLVAVGRGWGW